MQALLKAVQLQPYAVTGGQLFVPLTAVTLIAGSAIIQVRCLTDHPHCYYHIFSLQDAVTPTKRDRAARICFWVHLAMQSAWHSGCSIAWRHAHGVFY
jgi:hypothetical protein